MDFAEVIEHEIQGYRVHVILDLLTEGVREPGKAAHVHPHRQVSALDVAG